MAYRLQGLYSVWGHNYLLQPGLLHFPATCLWRSMSLTFAGLLTQKFKESVTFATTSLQMPQKALSVPLFCQNLTTVNLCYQAVQINFLTNCKRSKILQQDLSSKRRSKNTSNPFFKNSTGYQSTQESSTKSQPCATILSLKFTQSV